MTQTSLRDSEKCVHHPSLSFPCILPVNQEDASPALTPSHHLSLRPPGGKVAGRLDENITLSHFNVSLWKVLPDWLSRSLRSCPPFLIGQDIPLPISLHQLPGPLYHSHTAPPSSGSGPFPSHREAFKVATPCALFSARCMESSKRNITYHPKTHVSPSEGGQIAFVCSRHARPPPDILSISPNLGQVGTTWNAHQNLLKVKIYPVSPPLYHDFISAEIIEFIFLKLLYEKYYLEFDHS